MQAESEARKAREEQALRAQALAWSGDAAVGPELAARRERCQYGAGCARPGCVGLHPWDVEWVSSGAASGCDTRQQLRISESIYSTLTPTRMVSPPPDGCSYPCPASGRAAGRERV